MKTFKKFTPLLALVAVMFAFAPQQADASRHHHHGHTYVSGRTSCGCPIYTKKVVKYYERCGRPVYAYYRQPVKHRCKHHHYRPAPLYYNSCGTYRRPVHYPSYRRSSCGTRSGYSVSYRRGW